MAASALTVTWQMSTSVEGLGVDWHLRTEPVH